MKHICGAECIRWTARAHPHLDDNGNPHARAICDKCTARRHLPVHHNAAAMTGARRRR